MVAPSFLIAGIVGGIGFSIGAATIAYAQQKGPELTKSLKNDLSPMLPEEGPPLPRGLNIKWPWKK